MSTDAQRPSEHEQEEESIDAELFERLAEKFEDDPRGRIFEIIHHSASDNSEANR